MINGQIKRFLRSLNDYMCHSVCILTTSALVEPRMAFENERFERVAAAWPVREFCPGGEAALMSVIRESSRSRAPVLHMCCNELPIPDYRPGRPVSPRPPSPPPTRPPFFARRRGSAYRTSWKSSRAREEERARAQTSAVRMQITAPRCNHASIWWSTIIRTILLRRLVNRRIARAFAFTQPAHRAPLLFPKKRSVFRDGRRRFCVGIQMSPLDRTKRSLYCVKV